MPPSERKWLGLLKQLLLVNSAATVAAVTFNVTSFGLGAFSKEEFVSSFVYSNCIGTLICAVIVYLSPRWNENLVVVRFAKVFVSIFVATFVGVVAARLILSFIFPTLGNQTLIPGWRNFVFSLGIAFTFGFAYYFYETSQNRLAATKEALRQKELAEEKAKTLTKEAQIASLESRIHPHFLFNTLNSIAALIREEPILAEKMVEKLAALLRYSLDEHATSLVSLKQELEITEKYLEIEKARFGERLNYKIEADAKLADVKLPPLALQTLIENSIKHVVAKTSEPTAIRIAARENGAGIVVEVADHGKGFSAADLRAGHGLDTLQKRLATIYEGEAKLEIGGDGTVRLKIPKL